ncbi:MAG: isochorismatase family protein [Proteobacteria bacterium]|nr:MAG: isochorismatase family protein [Pseudomonadota bacterium]
MNDLDIYQKQGFGHNSGFGERPCLLIVDFVNGFADPAQFGGGNIADAITNTSVLLAKAREMQLPVAFTRVVYADDGSDAGVFCLKAPNLVALTEHAPASQVVAELEPSNGEYVIAKTQPSAFFGTNLAAWLIARRVDTVLVTGCTTSGCVRASVIDSMSYNFRTIVVSDCVGDRAIGPHEANLFDMEQKYADLMTAAEVAGALDGAAARVSSS